MRHRTRICDLYRVKVAVLCRKTQEKTRIVHFLCTFAFANAIERLMLSAKIIFQIQIYLLLMTITHDPNSGRYYYAFQVSKKRYHGACKGCTTQSQAEAFEKKMYKAAMGLASQRSVKGLINNYRRELTGGTDITLDEAFDLFAKKPARRLPGEQRLSMHRHHWDDFIAFMKANAPDIVRIDQVTRQHAEDYIAHLRSNGRFVQEVSSGNGKKDYKPNKASLSNTTINSYHSTLKSVFSRLENDAGIVENPFDFDTMRATAEAREIFTQEELELIDSNLNTDPFCRPIFVIGANTGLPLGDVCSLRWDDIRREEKGWFICRRRNKTGMLLEIPVLPVVKNILYELAAQRQKLTPEKQSPFVLPDHEEMYRTNRSGVSYRINKFLTRIGIKTTRETTGARNASVKDFHSLRHTFAYIAAVHKIPLSIVQSTLGHVSPQMTQHYQEHSTREDKLTFLGQLPALLGGNQATPSEQTQLPATAEEDGKATATELLPDAHDKSYWRGKADEILDNFTVEQLKAFVEEHGNEGEGRVRK